MIPIAVCDDERVQGLRTREVILSHGRVRDPMVQLFETPDALLDAIRLRDYCPRVAVLDIRMEGTDGIRLAEQINDLLPQCAVIFLTAFLEYATDVYETRHVYFILKSELEQRIGSALEKALDGKGIPPHLQLSSGSSVKSILLRDVLYLERILHKTRVRTRNGTEMVTTPPAELLKDVTEGAFIRCHQSYWVNYEHINAMEKNEFVLSDGTRIPISRTFRDSAKAEFFSDMRTH